MKMGKMFYLGMALAIAGIVLMSLPEKPCVDCDDEVTIEETIDEVSGD